MSDERGAARDAAFRRQYGPWAVIVGASTGIGLAFSRTLAARGLNLVLIARDAEVLGELATDLGLRHRIDVEIRAIDLAQPQAAALALSICDDFEVGMLVMVAAEHAIGEFTQRPVAEHERVIDVNVSAALSWSHAVLQRMRMRRRGGVIFMSSMTAHLGGPYLSSHVASKAFLSSFAEALYEENRELGVHVLGVLPGATDTPRYRAMTSAAGANEQADALGDHKGTGSLVGALRGLRRLASNVLTPQEVVTEALAALAHEPTVIPGQLNRMQLAALRRMPRKALLALMSRVMRDLNQSAKDPARPPST